MWFLLFILCCAISIDARYCAISQPGCTVRPLTSQKRFVRSGVNPLGQKFLQLSKKFDGALFDQLFNRIKQQYKNNPQGFLNILMTKDAAGFNVLMIAAKIGDLQRLDQLMEGVKTILGPHPELINQLFLQQDAHTVNLLDEGVSVGDRRIVDLLLSYAVDLLGNHPKFFFNFINSGSGNSGWKSVVDAADEGSSEILKMIVDAAQEVLGKDSRLYNKFINMEDKEGFTALDAAQNYRDIVFLRNNGARTKGDPEKVDPTYTRAIFLGKELIEASNRNDFQAFREILNQAVLDFQDNQGALFDFFYSRDDAGWTSLIHTAADGQYEFIKLLLDTVEANFSDKYRKSIFLGNNDFEGRTALHLALARRHYKIAELMVKCFMDYSVNKPLLAALINSPDLLSGFTPYMFLVYNTGPFDQDGFEFMQYMTSILADFFGKDSRIFGKIINWRDYNGWNVLAYASGHQVEKFLRSYGAIDKPQKPIPILTHEVTQIMMPSHHRKLLSMFDYTVSKPKKNTRVFYYNKKGCC